MRFGPWHPLERAVELAPAQPGVLQTRSEGLLALPRGKSAMVLYAASPPGQTLSDFLRAEGAALLATAGQAGARYIRYAATPRAAAELERLLGQFEQRFGARPPGNTGDTAPATGRAPP